MSHLFVQNKGSKKAKFIINFMYYTRLLMAADELHLILYVII